MTGDGDSLSIGGNHLIHALRRNVPVKILLFNNQIYGLTKGQASPTSELGKITKSTPFGVADQPFNPVALALGAEATFVARTIDRDRKHLTEVLRAAAQHEGAALVEIYQNCPVFNDGAFAALTEKDVKDANQIRLEAGEPIRFGVEGERGVARGRDGGLEIVDVADAGEDALIVHDPTRPDPGLAFSLARLAEDPTGPTPIGIFRAVQRPVYGRSGRVAPEPASDGQLAELLHSARHLDRRLSHTSSASAPRRCTVTTLEGCEPRRSSSCGGRAAHRPSGRSRTCARRSTTRAGRRRGPDARARGTTPTLRRRDSWARRRS